MSSSPICIVEVMKENVENIGTLVSDIMEGGVQSLLNIPSLVSKSIFLYLLK